MTSFFLYDIINPRKAVKRMKIKGAIFDMDGTLIDSMYTWRHRGDIYLKSLGLQPREDLHLDVRKAGFLKAPQLIKDEYGLTADTDEISAEMMKVVENYYKYDSTLKNGTAEFLKALKDNGVKMCIATATDRHMVESGLEHCSIRDYFDGIFTCGELKTNKTEPLIFEKALEHLGTDKENTVIFEDALYAIETAKRSGFFTAGIYDEQEPEQEKLRSLCDIFVYDLRDTLGFLL